MPLVARAALPFEIGEVVECGVGDGVADTGLVVAIGTEQFDLCEFAVLVVPFSSSVAPSILRPSIDPETGIDNPSAAICRGIRGVARSRLLRRLGQVDDAKMAEIERAVGLVLATA